MTKVASESLSAFRTVQAFNAQPQEERKFGGKVDNVLALVRREALASGAFFGASGWSGNVTLLALLGYGGSLVSKGVISVGDLTSMLLYTVYVGNGLSMLTWVLSLLRSSALVTERVVVQIVLRFYYACCWCWDAYLRAA